METSRAEKKRDEEPLGVVDQRLPSKDRWKPDAEMSVGAGVAMGKPNKHSQLKGNTNKL